MQGASEEGCDTGTGSPTETAPQGRSYRSSHAHRGVADRADGCGEQAARDDGPSRCCAASKPTLSNEGDIRQVEQMEREFTYNGVRQHDHGSELSVDQVRDIYSATYSEITTASLEGPEAVGNKLVYRFSRAIGSKG
jgi:PRTRC genetic system protein C